MDDHTTNCRKAYNAGHEDLIRAAVRSLTVILVGDISFAQVRIPIPISESIQQSAPLGQTF